MLWLLIAEIWSNFYFDKARLISNVLNKVLKRATPPYSDIKEAIQLKV